MGLVIQLVEENAKTGLDCTGWMNVGRKGKRGKMLGRSSCRRLKIIKNMDGKLRATEK